MLIKRLLVYNFNYRFHCWCS